MIYDGQVIIILEGLQYFTEFESKKESEIKFWLPRSFPKNVRVIITADKRSKSYANLQKRNCQFLDVDRNLFISTDIIGALLKKKCFMGNEYVLKFIEELKELAEDLEFDRTMVKTLTCTFCPYETPGILGIDQVNLAKVEAIVNSINFYDE